LIFISLALCETLLWSDEFDGTTLDLTKWTPQVDCWGGGNNELECYTSRSQNIKVQNGNLILSAVPGTYTGTIPDCTNNNDNSCGNTKGYTSGKIQGKISTLYGRWEIRAKLPRGDFLWPALWMFPTDNVYGSWAASGEIDIMENRGQDINKILGTLQFGGVWPDNTLQGSGAVVPNGITDLTADYHLYGLVWNSSTIAWSVDGIPFYSINLNRSFFSGQGTNPYTKNGQPFDQRMFPIINLAIGGNFFPSSYGTLNSTISAAWPNPNFAIDYWRVYTSSNVSSSTTAASSATVHPSTSGSSAVLKSIPSSSALNGTAEVESSAGVIRVGLLMVLMVLGSL